MLNRVVGVGTTGIVRDPKPQILPHNVWTDGRNIRFDQDRCFAMGGVEAGLASTKTNLLNCGLINSATTKFTIYTDGTNVYSFDGTTENTINKTATTYNETADMLFDISSFNGLGLLNNGVDTPQRWDPSVGSNLLVDLDNWNSTWTAKKIRKFKAFLIALGMTEGANEYPHKMRWSTPAAAGAMPATWDETDATQEAGEFSFPDTSFGELVDGLELGERFFVYKEGAIWALSYVGGLDILARERITENIGLSVPRSLINLPMFGDSSVPVQFFAGDEAFYINDGQRVYPILERVFQREILKIADSTNYKTRSFSVVNPRYAELWFCIPEAGESYATLAFVINYKNGTHTIRELSGASTIASGIGVDYAGAAAIQDISFSDETYFSDGTGFSNSEVVPGRTVMLEASPGNEMLYYLDTGRKDYDNTDYVSYVVRESLAATKMDPRVDRQGQAYVDYKSRKLLGRVYPMLNEGSAQLQVGVQETEKATIAWLDKLILDESLGYHDLSCPVSGRFLSFRFESLADAEFDISGFDYEVQTLGEF